MVGNKRSCTESRCPVRHRNSDILAYDPWGARRTVNRTGGSATTNRTGTWSPSYLATAATDYAKSNKATVTQRGFTRHEHLDEVGIIHMNGRIYDATIGRFLQADPHIDGADTVAGFNRYAYVKNNPLNATDPTGYFGFLVALGVGAYLFSSDGKDAFRSFFRWAGPNFGNYAIPFMSAACGPAAPYCAAYLSYSLEKPSVGYRRR
jgi:RHS repeat-associated protein